MYTIYNINDAVLHTFLSSSQHLQIFPTTSSSPPSHEALIPHWLRRGQCLTQNPEDQLAVFSGCPGCLGRKKGMKNYPIL